MQELLGRLGALDPQASQGLRVIACFDELMAGGVAVHGLLSAAAALAGVPAGMSRAGKATRVSPRGEVLSGEPPSERCATGDVEAGIDVWLERNSAQPFLNDAIILERLALAVRLRLDPMDGNAGGAMQRALGTLVGDDSTDAERRAAAVQLRLTDGVGLRIVTAPLFAVWSRHPRGPEDVIWTAFGPVHAVVIAADEEVRGSPLGLGVTTGPQDLARSFRTSLIALRLCDSTEATAPPLRADDLGGLIEVLAATPIAADGDAAGMREIVAHPWGYATVDALVRNISMREASREIGVHHSTMASRLATMEALLGFDPVSGLGRTRLGIAFLRWRLQNSRVFELPVGADDPPVGGR